MKAGELQPNDSFTLLNCEPYLEGVIFTVRQPFGGEMECWNERTTCCFIPQHQQVMKVAKSAAPAAQQS